MGSRIIIELILNLIALLWAVVDMALMYLVLDVTGGYVITWPLILVGGWVTQGWYTRVCRERVQREGLYS